jgi:hypothetical protein
VLRKWQKCCKLGVILRTERSSIHGYLPTVQMASPKPRLFCCVSADSLRYPLSYRDLQEMMCERGLHVDHTTIYRSRTTLRTRTGEAMPAPSQNHERLVARRRDVHQSEKGLDVSVSCRGFSGKHFGIFAQPHKKYSSGQTLLLNSACRCVGYLVYPFQNQERTGHAGNLNATY